MSSERRWPVVRYFWGRAHTLDLGREFKPLQLVYLSIALERMTIAAVEKRLVEEVEVAPDLAFALHNVLWGALFVRRRFVDSSFGQPGLIQVWTTEAGRAALESAEV